MTLLIEKILFHLINYSSSYLIYVGTTIISIEYLFRRKWIKSIILFLIGLVWVGSYYSLVSFLGQLGVDSFQEVHNFDVQEAIFWFETFFFQFEFYISLRKFIFYNIILLIIYFFITTFIFLLKVSKKNRIYLKKSLAIIFIFFSIYQTTWSSLNLFFKNSDAFIQVRNNFDNIIPSVSSNPKLNILLYIGESTSVMNMSLYGYPRLTNPNLSRFEAKEKGFIKFENVLSTHTHTSPSLLEAFSIGIDESDKKLLPISQRPRISLIDILKETDISTEYVSNQGSSGNHHYASSIIFDKAIKIFSSNDRLLGNNAYKFEKPLDHIFFNKNFNQKKLDSILPSLNVFHGYAGHGPYTDFIPKNYQNSLDNFFKKMNSAAVTGKIDSLKSVEDYDKTIYYNDYSVSNALQLVKDSSKPWIFIYFSDHGDAPFANRGHDSSVFIHEMARIPFIIFFNDAAIDTEPELYKKYFELSKKKLISTLAQLSPTILDLFNVSFAKKIRHAVIGASSSPAPILVRETNEGITAINLSMEDLKYGLIDKTDSATSHFVASRFYKNNEPLICYHGSNSIAKALRGSLVASCLEIDIVVDENAEVLAYKPPSKNNGLKLQHIFSSIKFNDRISFWLDGKNLTSNESCNGLLSFLEKQTLKTSQNILVEFPSGSHSLKPKIEECVKKLKSIFNVYVSYYVPTGIAVTCSKSISRGNAFNITSSCGLLEKDLLAAKNSKLFTDISFDSGGIKAIEAIKFTSNFKWNTWHVEPSELKVLQPNRFRMIILFNDDPN